MARWRLLEPHYLHTEPGVVWEYMETDRTTGRQTRKQFPVPQYFHHEVESDWTDKQAQMVVVSDGKGAKTGDIVFKGEPTPGMMPLDDEAKAISSKFREKWSLPDKMFDPDRPGDYSTNLADHFVQQQDKVNMQMTKLEEKRAQGFDQLMQGMTALMQQNSKILEALSNKVVSLEEKRSAKV